MLEHALNEQCKKQARIFTCCTLGGQGTINKIFKWISRQQLGSKTIGHFAVSWL